MSRSGSKSQEPRRVGQVVYLRSEYFEEYKKCHAAVWPEVLAQIKDSNIEDCILNPVPARCILPDRT